MGYFSPAAYWCCSSDDFVAHLTLPKSDWKYRHGSTPTAIPVETGIQGARVGVNALTGTTPQHSASSVMDTATALVYNTKVPTSADSLRLRTLAEVAELVDAQR